MSLSDQNKAKTQIRQWVAKYAPEVVVIFAPSLSWDAVMFQRPHQLARALARAGALVFYLNPYSWPVQFEEKEERLVVCAASPDAFSVVPEAFVYFLPWNAALQVSFPGHPVVYDYLDDLSVFQGDPEQLRRLHGELLLQSDLVLASSEALLAQARRVRPDALLLPNAVDYAHFADPSAKETIPADLAQVLALGKPVIGYHGALAEWIDYSLLRALSQRRREWSFVFIGVEHDETLKRSGLLEEPNVFWLGPKAYRDLPSYVQHFSVGLIPFQVNELTKAVSPIKLFEYFAAGVPVVASPLPECQRYDEVLLASSIEEWESALAKGIERSGEPAFRAALQQVARQQTWARRAETLLSHLRALPKHARRQPWYVRFAKGRAARLAPVRLGLKVVKVLRLSGWRGLFKGVYYKAHELLREKQQYLPRLRWSLWEDRYFIEDNAQVVLYTDDRRICPDYAPRRSLDKPCEPLPKVTLISTSFNEAETAPRWIQGIARQTRWPDEIIVVDGGSEDGTPEVLQQEAERWGLPLRVLSVPGANIAEGRNLAIREARFSVVASLDMGCVPHPEWLEKLIKPFCLDPQIEVVAGWYRALDKTGNESTLPGWPTLASVNPQEFLPSSRSLAFRVEAWEKAGGYPEWLSLTGEDTYFAMELKRHTRRWAFVPEAMVDWEGPTTWGDLWRKAVSWNQGDGEIGYNAWLYRKIFRRALGAFIGYLLLGVALWIGGQWMGLGIWAGLAALVILLAIAVGKGAIRGPLGEVVGRGVLQLAQLYGFISGARRRRAATHRRLQETKGLVFMLTGIPIDDTGGGARCTQLTLELIRRGYWMVYINRFPKWETVDSGVRIAHPNLFLYEWGRFSWQKFQQEFGHLFIQKPLYGIVELPLSEYLPLIWQLHRAGGVVVYELIDEWDTSLGGYWYSPEVEKQIANSSQVLVATAPKLKQKLEEMTGRPVELLPNAVNTLLFDPDKYYPRPADLPEAEWIAMYIGALWGDWFDWRLLRTIAEAYPEAAVVVIGDYRGQCASPPPNLHFLGLKPQRVLPAYLAYAQVALIPWVVSAITQATSPLKLYEYLAMQRPVVAPDLEPLQGIPGVYLARDAEEFVCLVAEAARRGVPEEAVRQFVALHNWQARVDRLLEILREGSHEGEGK